MKNLSLLMAIVAVLVVAGVSRAGNCHGQVQQVQTAQTIVQAVPVVQQAAFVQQVQHVQQVQQFQNVRQFNQVRNVGGGGNRQVGIFNVNRGGAFGAAGFGGGNRQFGLININR